MSGLIGPDYKKLLKYIASPYDVDVLCDLIVEHGGDPDCGVKVVKAIGGGKIADLDQDGLQRAYFELTLLDVGAWLTYERVRQQRSENYPMPIPALHHACLLEIEQLIMCVEDCGWRDEYGWSDTAVQSIIDNALDKTGIYGAELLDLDWLGRNLVYKDFVKALVNPGARLQATTDAPLTI